MVNRGADKTASRNCGVGVSREAECTLRTRYSALLRLMRGHAGSLGK